MRTLFHILSYHTTEIYHWARAQNQTGKCQETKDQPCKNPGTVCHWDVSFYQAAETEQKKILTIYDSFDYLSKQQNIIWIGPTSTGKTGLATAFLTQSIEKGYRGKFVLFSELVEILYQSVADHTEAKILKMFESYDCLLIDELGYVETNPVQVGLFFTLMHRRHKKKSTLITSNLGFDQWGSFLKNNQLTAALIDRLTENSHVINMNNCQSLRARLGQE